MLIPDGTIRRSTGTIRSSSSRSEGRWSGTHSQACASGGTGADFAHEHGSDQMVTAAHVSGANSGNMGVALLGEFTTKPRSGGDPKAAAVDALEDVLAELSLRHGLDPTGSVHYVNPVNGTSKDVATISAHRDWSSTECPGQRLYDQLPVRCRATPPPPTRTAWRPSSRTVGCRRARGSRRR